jgi:hypothetical protein
MHARISRHLALLIPLVVGGVLAIAGSAAATPAYGEGGPAVALSASVSGDSITADGSGFVPGEPVTGTVFSTPMDLGTKDADAGGHVSFTFSVRDLEPGKHRVVLSAPSGSVTSYFTVAGTSAGDGGSSVTNVDQAASAGDELAYTGSDLVVPAAVVGLLLVLGGVTAVVIGRRGRARAGSRR